MVWKLPPRIKVYEALGAIADNRIELVSPTQAKVKSSSGNKAYDVIYNEESKIISANDNGSYWQGYLGYPAIAYLMLKKRLPFDQELSQKLKGISWKEINQKFKNNFAKIEAYLFQLTPQDDLEKFADHVINELHGLHLQPPAVKQKPPAGW